MTVWAEVGDRVFVRRYAFFDQNIGVVLGDEGALVVDTRTTHRQAREVLDDLRAITTMPVSIVVDTHGHYDHVFGNAVFRPAEIWGHAGCVAFMKRTGEQRVARSIVEHPDLADDLREVVIDPPDRTFLEEATVDLPGRRVRLRFLGRGHTDHDIVVLVDDADVVFAGDLLEGGAVPYFGDGYPLDWPATAARLADLVTGVVVPGHGGHAERSFALEQLAGFRDVAELGRAVAAGELDLEAAMRKTPFPGYPPEHQREALERAVAQVRGELD